MSTLTLMEWPYCVMYPMGSHHRLSHYSGTWRVFMSGLSHPGVRATWHQLSSNLSSIVSPSKLSVNNDMYLLSTSQGPSAHQSTPRQLVTSQKNNSFCFAHQSKWNIQETWRVITQQHWGYHSFSWRRLNYGLHRWKRNLTYIKY